MAAIEPTTVPELLYLADDGRARTFHTWAEIDVDGGEWHTSIQTAPADEPDDDAVLQEAVAERMADRDVDRWLVALDVKTDVVASGPIEAAHVLDGRLCFRVDDPQLAAPEDLPDGVDDRIL